MFEVLDGARLIGAVRLDDVSIVVASRVPHDPSTPTAEVFLHSGATPATFWFASRESRDRFIAAITLSLQQRVG